MRKIVHEFGELLRKGSMWTFIMETGEVGRAIFLCECGNLRVVMKSAVRKGNSESCGCASRTKHGYSKHPYYDTLKGIHYRCYDESAGSYPHYGGRGIKVCESWSITKEGFENFIRDMGERPEGCSIERLDNDGDYCASNCVWADNSVQGLNRRRPARNKTGHVGVRYQKSRKKYEAQISHGGVNYYLGRYEKLEDAVAARRTKELELTGKINTNKSVLDD